MSCHGDGLKRIGRIESFVLGTPSLRARLFSLKPSMLSLNFRQLLVSFCAFSFCLRLLETLTCLHELALRAKQSIAIICSLLFRLCCLNFSLLSFRLSARDRPTSRKTLRGKARLLLPFHSESAGLFR